MRRETLDELVVNARIDDDAVRAHADLALMEVAAEDRGAHRLSDIRVVEHHERRIASQLECETLDDRAVCREPRDAAANRAKLLRALEGVPTERRGAFFICVLVLLQHADDPAPLIAEGRWHGRVLEAERGGSGFGYDPLFLPDGHTHSAAELEPALKNRLSHRGQALARLHAQLA